MDPDENIVLCPNCKKDRKVILDKYGYYCSVCKRIIVEYDRNAVATKEFY